MNIHSFHVAFALNGFLYVGYLFLSGEWRVLFPDKSHGKTWALLMLNSLRISRKNRPREKFNAAQRIVYTGVILLGFIMLLNGLAIYKPVQLHWLCALFGGYENAGPSTLSSPYFLCCSSWFTSYRWSCTDGTISGR